MLWQEKAIHNVEKALLQKCIKKKYEYFDLHVIYDALCLYCHDSALNGFKL